MTAGFESAGRSWISQLRKGLVELLVLAALDRREAYGYELLQRLEEFEGLALTESTLYPVLARLSQEKFLAVRQEPSPTGPPRRYYRLTASGRRRLREMLAHWGQIVSSVNELIASHGDPKHVRGIVASRP